MGRFSTNTFRLDFMHRNIIWLILLAGFAYFQPLQAQVTSRSGFPAPQIDISQFRLFPCGGSVITEETFSDTDLPAGWLSLDMDGFMPDTNINNFLVNGGGWQSILDFRSPQGMNRSVASPSWYADTTGPSNDFLISPKVSLGGNTCLSWTAYSQDQYFRESYEVLISTTTPDTAGFFANDPLLVVEAEGYELNYRSVNLANYAEMDVYIAFRHTSEDKFILVLDDMRISSVPNQDIGIVDFSPIIADTSDEVFIRAAVRNYGSDTLRFDSTLILTYRVGSGDPKVSTIQKSFVIAPNDTVQVTHDSVWVPTGFGAEIICLTTDGNLMPDEDPSNDGLCRWASVGTTGLIGDKLPIAVRIYPNPVSDVLRIELSAENGISGNLEMSLLDMFGRPVQPVQLINPNTYIEVSSLPAGIYLLRIQDEKGRVFTEKVKKQ